MRAIQENLYAILRLPPSCNFEDLKRSFRAIAKECHPDLYGNDPQKTAAFQRLVNAFDILSDPESRAAYDRQRGQWDAEAPSPNILRSNVVMDSLADDILEEMVVGNEVPEDATLKTLMLDLERTETFIAFRQAKNHFFANRHLQCKTLCEYLVRISPDNILYHYYLAESSRKLGHNLKSAWHFLRCLHIGARRNPPQRLLKVQRHYQMLKENWGLLGKLIKWLSPPEEKPQLTPEEEMQRALEQTFSKGMKNARKRSAHPPKALLK